MSTTAWSPENWPPSDLCLPPAPPSISPPPLAQPPSPTEPSARKKTSASPVAAPKSGMCQVCTVVPFQFQHFGAYVCNRCRAFFRRTVRRSRKGCHLAICLSTKAPLPPEASPSCDITVFRGACQACRFLTCINVGMTPNSVLTDEARVEKYPKRGKKKKTKADSHSDEDPPAAAPEKKKRTRSCRKKEPKDELKQEKEEKEDNFKPFYVIPQGEDGGSYKMQILETEYSPPSPVNRKFTPPPLMPPPSPTMFSQFNMISPVKNEHNYGGPPPCHQQQQQQQGGFQPVSLTPYRWEWQPPPEIPYPPFSLNHNCGQYGAHSFYYDRPIVDPPWLDSSSSSSCSEKLTPDGCNITPWLWNPLGNQSAPPSAIPTASSKNSHFEVMTTAVIQDPLDLDRVQMLHHGARESNVYIEEIEEDPQQQQASPVRRSSLGTPQQRQMLSTPTYFQDIEDDPSLM